MSIPKRNVERFKKKGYFPFSKPLENFKLQPNILASPEEEHQPIEEKLPEIPYTYLDAFEKTIGSLTNPVIINNELYKQITDQIKNTTQTNTNNESEVFTLTDEEYIKHVISKLSVLNNDSKPIKLETATPKIIKPIKLETATPKIIKPPIPIKKEIPEINTKNEIQVKSVSSVEINAKNIKGEISNMFKERSSLETRILNSPLFDVEILKTLNLVFNKKLSELCE